MRIKDVSRVYWLAPAMLLLLAAGCSGGGEGDTAAKDSADAAAEVARQDGAAADKTPVEVTDACVLFDKMELEQILGWELYDGEREEMPPGQYACDFATPPLFYVTRKYPDPALPESVHFSSIRINTNPTTPENFKEFRELIAVDGEDVPGIGDETFFYGPDIIYGRVGRKAFSLRMYAEPQTDEDRAIVREMMLTLARKAAEKL